MRFIVPTMPKLTKRASPILAALALTLMSAPMMSAEARVNNVAAAYQNSCAACHDSGALNAPKKGDQKLWSKLKKEKGMPALVKSVKGGMIQMPAGGLCTDCDDSDYQKLIEYMSK